MMTAQDFNRQSHATVSEDLSSDSEISQQSVADDVAPAEAIATIAPPEALDTEAPMLRDLAKPIAPEIAMDSEASAYPPPR